MKKKYLNSPLGKNNIRRAVYTDYKVVRIRTETNGWGAVKSLVVMAVLGLQLALIVSIYMFLGYLFKWYLTLSYILSLLTCIYVLSTNKNSLSKAVWVIFILVSFGFGYIIYFLSDERIFFGRSKKKYKKIFEGAQKYRDDNALPEGHEPIARDAEYLFKTGGFVPYTFTELKYYPSGAQLFDAVLEELDKAEKFIFIELYIISDGVLLKRVLDVLERKAASGVDIRIIYDFIGCHRTLSVASQKRIKKAGIKIMPFNRLTSRFSVALNFRDHRKMIIVDGRTVFTGGANLADEYINEKRMFGYWKDAGLRAEGNAVSAFTLFFLRQWEFVTGAEEDYSPYVSAAQPKLSDSVVIPYADGLDYDYHIGKNVYENIISAAKERLYVMTPYFIPDDSLLQLLINKALSGTDVRLILPGIPDKSFVYSVTRNYAEKLIDVGVKVYCMKNSFVHSKLMLSENCAVIGSINLDLRSFYQQFEVAVYTDDRGVIGDLLSDFQSTFERSELIGEGNRMRRNILHRLYAGMLQLVAPFM